MSGNSGQLGFSYSYAPSVLALSITLGILDIGVVALRLATRRKQKATFGVDDGLIVAGLAFTLGLAIICIAGTALGALGYPTLGIDYHNPASIAEQTYYHRITNQCQWTSYIFSVLALGCIKLSFLFFLRRVFCTRVQRLQVTAFSLAAWALIGLVSLWTLAFFIAWFTTCGNNLTAFWGSFSELLVYCNSSVHILVAMSISDAVLDVIIVLLPLPMIWSLHLTTRKKLAVTSVFLVGFVVVAASLSRMVLVLRSQNRSGGVDPDLYVTNVIWWTMFETGMALIGSCLSSLPPLFVDLSARQIFQSIRSRLSGSGNRRSAGDESERAKPTHRERLFRREQGGASQETGGFELHQKPSLSGSQQSAHYTTAFDTDAERALP